MNATCYSRDELKSFILGRLPDSTLDEISNHLDECDTCEDTVVGLEKTTDTLISHIHKKLESDNAASASEPYLNHAISELLNPSRQRPSSSPTRPTPNLEAIGPYNILKPLAAGGMGTVYLAEHAKLGKQVALKVLHHRRLNDPEFVRRFEREMKIVGGLSHPALVNATDAGEFDDVPYLAMDFVDGLDLGCVSRELGVLPVADACEIIRQAALGLDYVHRQGVLHRDIKPSNLMLGPDGSVKILDLGLATLSGWNHVDDLTTIGQLLGTLDYMAPEQADQESTANEKSDIFGLAATLYKLLTGVAPYYDPHVNTALQKLRALAIQAPVPIQERLDNIPKALAKLIDESLSIAPEDRPASAIRVAEALSPFCESANLSELLTRAKAQTRNSSAEQNASILLSSNSHASWLAEPQHSANGLLSKSSLDPEMESDSKRGWGLAVGLMMLGFAIWASVVIYLQTQKGTLVIESDIEDISVSVVEDGEIEKDIRLDHGVESTRLYAGKYKVEIRGNTDGLVVENGMFLLRKGETVVTKIRRQVATTPPSSLNRPTGTGMPPGSGTISAGVAGDPRLSEKRNSGRFGGGRGGGVGGSLGGFGSGEGAAGLSGGGGAADFGGAGIGSDEGSYRGGGSPTPLAQVRKKNGARYNGKTLEDYFDSVLNFNASASRRGPDYRPLKILSQKSTQQETQAIIDRAISLLRGELSQTRHSLVLVPAAYIVNSEEQFLQIVERFRTFAKSSLGSGTAMFNNSAFRNICVALKQVEPDWLHQYTNSKLESSDPFEQLFGLALARDLQTTKLNDQQNKSTSDRLIRIAEQKFSNGEVDYTVKQTTMDLLSTNYPKNARTLPTLLQILESKDFRVQDVAIYHLRKLKPANEKLAKICTDRCRKVPELYYDLTRLIKVNPVAVEGIGELLSDPEWGTFTKPLSGGMGGMLSVGGGGGGSMMGMSGGSSLSSRDLAGLLGASGGGMGSGSSAPPPAKRERVRYNKSVRYEVLRSIRDFAYESEEAREQLSDLAPVLKKLADVDETYSTPTWKCWSAITGEKPPRK